MEAEQCKGCNDADQEGCNIDGLPVRQPRLENTLQTINLAEQHMQAKLH